MNIFKEMHLIRRIGERTLKIDGIHLNIPKSVKKF
jgi:hypothetical protein